MFNWPRPILSTPRPRESPSLMSQSKITLCTKAFWGLHKYEKNDIAEIQKLYRRAGQIINEFYPVFSSRVRAITTISKAYDELPTILTLIIFSWSPSRFRKELIDIFFRLLFVSYKDLLHTSALAPLVLMYVVYVLPEILTVEIFFA